MLEKAIYMLDDFSKPLQPDYRCDAIQEDVTASVTLLPYREVRYGYSLTQQQYNKLNPIGKFSRAQEKRAKELLATLKQRVRKAMQANGWISVDTPDREVAVYVKSDTLRGSQVTDGWETTDQNIAMYARSNILSGLQPTSGTLKNTVAARHGTAKSPVLRPRPPMSETRPLPICEIRPVALSETPPLPGILQDNTRSAELIETYATNAVDVMTCMSDELSVIATALKSQTPADEASIGQAQRYISYIANNLSLLSRELEVLRKERS